MAPELIVRLATPVDASPLSAFAARTFREAFSDRVSPDAMKKYLDESFPEARVAAELADPETIFLLAVDTVGEFGGYCKLHLGSSPVSPPAPNPGGAGGEGAKASRATGERATPTAFPPAPPGLGAGGLTGRPGMPVKLWRLYTAREWQGRGVGALLLEHAATVARERGGSVFWLTVNTENTGAVRFYTRNGFVRTGFASFDLGGEIQRDFVMERVL